MIRRIFKLFLYDVLFQFRHGFYAIYAIVSVLYIAILFSFSTHRLLVTNALVFSDTSILGLVFVGAILLLEKQQNILHSLFVTPVKLSEYLLAKVMSLTLISILASFAILLVPNGVVPSLGLFLLGVALSSSIFILIGLAIGAKVNTMNGYIFGIMLGTIVFAAPLVSYFGLYDGLWLYVLPTRASLFLLSSTFLSISSGQLWYSIINLIVWNIGAWRLATWSFSKYIIQGR
jgi:fluoroquinolone transport system permease protein